jgi:hypothetical protein
MGGARSEASDVNGASNEEQPTIRPIRSTPSREAVTLEPVEHLEGTVAAVIMAMLGALFGVATLVLSGDHRLALGLGAAAFGFAGIVLTVRLWRMTRPPASASEPSA